MLIMNDYYFNNYLFFKVLCPLYYFFIFFSIFKSFSIEWFSSIINDDIINYDWKITFFCEAGTMLTISFLVLYTLPTHIFNIL